MVEGFTNEFNVPRVVTQYYAPHVCQGFKVNFKNQLSVVTDGCNFKNMRHGVLDVARVLQLLFSAQVPLPISF